MFHNNFLNQFSFLWYTRFFNIHENINQNVKNTSFICFTEKLSIERDVQIEYLQLYKYVTAFN